MLEIETWTSWSQRSTIFHALITVGAAVCIYTWYKDGVTQSPNLSSTRWKWHNQAHQHPIGLSHALENSDHQRGSTEFWQALCHQNVDPIAYWAPVVCLLKQQECVTLDFVISVLRGEIMKRFSEYADRMYKVLVAIVQINKSRRKKETASSKPESALSAVNVVDKDCCKTVQCCM